jgi:proline racemase
VPAVRPSITGRAWVTGRAEWVLDPTDPFPEGFSVADVWPAATVSTPSPSDV